MNTRRALNGEAELPPPPALREANFYALSFASLHLCESLHAGSARPLLPHLERIANELRAHGASTDLVASVPGHRAEAVAAMSAAIH